MGGDTHNVTLPLSFSTYQDLTTDLIFKAILSTPNSILIVTSHEEDKTSPLEWYIKPAGAILFSSISIFLCKMSLVTIDRSRKPLELAIRKFIFCSYRVFDDVKNRSDELQNGTGDAKTATTSKQSVLCNGSRLFRDQISTLLSDIDVLQSTFFDEKDSEYLFQPEYDLAAYLNTTWHLCEIFFLNQTNSSSLEVIQWFKV